MRHDILAHATLALALFGCAEEAPSRPPAVGLGGQNTPTNGSGAGGEGSEETPDGAADGRVVQFSDATFEESTAYSGRAEVFVSSESGTTFTEADYDGAEFSVEGDVEGTRWVRAVPTADTAMFSTLSQQQLGEGAVDVPLVRRAVLDQVAASFTDPIEIVDTRAHLVLSIVEESGAGIEGVTVSVFVAGSPTIAYKQGAVWQTFLDSTTIDGLVLVPNLPAIPYPGQAIQVVLTGAVEAELDVRLASETVTVARYVVP